MSHNDRVEGRVFSLRSTDEGTDVSEVAMQIDDALEHADEWIKGVTLYEGAQGWRVACATLAAEVRRLRGLVGGSDDLSQALVDRLENLEVQAVREIAPGWVGIPAVEWDSIMGPNV